MSTRKVPEIRFSGFDEDWEERELGDEVDIYDGTHQTPIYTESGIMFLSVENIQTLYSSKFISEEDFEKGFKVFPEKGDVLMTRIGDVGTTNVIRTDEKIAFYVSLALLKPKKINSNYLSFSINSSFVQDEIWKRTLHIAFPKKINKNEIAKVRINVPSLCEQIKVGDFFKQLDDTITLNEQELNNLKQTKQGFLQKMFPKEGQSVPEIRFSGFSDDWEECKLGDLIQKLTGGTSIAPSDYVELGVPTVPKGAINNRGIADLSNRKFVNQDFFFQNYTSAVQSNSLITALRDLVPTAPNMGRIVKLISATQEYLMPQGVYKLDILDNVHEQFLISFSNSNVYRKIINQEKNGSTQVHIRNQEFLNIPISVPDYKEQTQIGNFFKQIDDTITIYECELDTLKQTKKAFLQKMFI